MTRTTVGRRSARGLAPTLAPLVLAAAPALAAPQGGGVVTECFDATTQDSAPVWAETISLPQFPPAQGLLVSVTLTVEATTAGSNGIENTGPTPESVESTFEAKIEIVGAPLAAPFAVFATEQFLDPLAAFDGTIDFAGPSGVLHEGILAQGSDTITFVDPSDLAPFIGNGTLSFDVTAEGTSNVSGGGNLVQQVVQTASATVTVCYAYAADCNGNGIPDPLDIQDGTSLDCDGNLVPDECQPDCDGNGLPDACDPCPGTELDCTEFDRFEDLTAADTLTLVTSAHHPNPNRGFVYVFAVDDTGAPIAFDHLVGQAIQVDAVLNFDYATNPLDFRATRAEGLATDVDADGIRDLDGSEYEPAPGEILVPRFLGQSADGPQTELVLIGLSGGAQFTTTVDFLIYNDNEEVFSGEHSFRCWTKVPLLAISGAFGQDWLAGFSGQDPSESVGPYESGWYRLWGALAQSSQKTIEAPAVYAVQNERVRLTAAADLPFERCSRPGHLFPRSLLGDNSEAAGPGNGSDCGETIARRRPGSLLLFPEFDNRPGRITVLSVTNTNAEAGTRVHFLYISRYGF